MKLLEVVQSKIGILMQGAAPDSVAKSFANDLIEDRDVVM